MIRIAKFFKDRRVAVVEVFCPYCNGKKVVKNGNSTVGEQRYKCRKEDCGKTFQLQHRYNACGQGVKERIVDMAMNGSGVRDTVQKISQKNYLFLKVRINA